MESLISLADLPRAAWVVATVVGDSRDGEIMTDWPLEYRVGFPTGLTALQLKSLEHHLGAGEYVAEMSGYPTTEYGVATLLDVVVSNPTMNRAALREIKEVVRPECPYTAVLKASLEKWPGNTGMVWVGIRDYISDAARQEIVARLAVTRGIVSATLRGQSTLELRVDWALASKPEIRLTAPLCAVGIYPDFSLSRYVREFALAFDPEAGF